jgi:ribose transport system permease protein
MTGKVAGLTPVVILLVLFVIGATVLLSRTTFGRRLYAVGNSRTVALFSGVFVGSILVKTYALSGLCAAVVGIMLVGFSGQAFNDMGDPYLLPAIAAVVIGGTLMSGGQGHYLGMFGGALLLTALTTVLTGLLLPDSMRSIVFGIAVLAAIISLREKSA